MLMFMELLIWAEHEALLPSANVLLFSCCHWESTTSSSRGALMRLKKEFPHCWEGQLAGRE
jgi:hypothetical protein